MATAEATLRARMKTVLCTSHCNQIRFQLDNVKIEFLMYNYVAGLIEQGKIRVKMDSGPSYDHRTDLITFSDVDTEPNVIVHEATHALIDAVYPGLTITKGTGEACAYLAETIYSWIATGGSRDLDIPHLTAPVSRLAKEVLAYNATHSDAYVCPGDQLQYIKGIMSNVMEIGRKDTMDGMAAYK